MKKLFAFALLLFPLLTFGQGTPIITLHFPYTTLAKGQSGIVTWDSVDSDSTEYSVKLAGGSLSSPRAIGTVDTDTVENFTITIPADTPTGSGYLLQFISSNGTIYPSQTFSITGPSSTTQTETVPAQNSVQTQLTGTSTATTTAMSSLIQELKRMQDEVAKKAATTDQISTTTSCILISSNIGYGAKDTTQKGVVSLVQNFLYEKGYLLTKPTGFVGPKTVSAIIKFQKEKGIRVTGVLGPITRAKIQKITCAI